MVCETTQAAVDSQDILTDGMGLAPPNKKLKCQGSVNYPAHLCKRQRSMQSIEHSVSDSIGVGAVGIDLGVFDKEHGRPKRTASVIGTQCFIFPICHDAELYGRVKEVQKERRQLVPLMMDPVIMDMVKTEAGEEASFYSNDILPTHK